MTELGSAEGKQQKITNNIRLQVAAYRKGVKACKNDYEHPLSTAEEKTASLKLALKFLKRIKELLEIK